MNYKKLNNYIGWLVFVIASFVYILTVEETASLWDCGEFIATAYKLEVGHPPGAPFFMLIGRLFSLFAGEVTEVGYWMNIMSALCSSFTILFLFWSITLLGRKVAEKGGEVMSNAQKIVIMGSGFVGAMTYTFSDSFWFSAVEAEVYAMSSLFTAVIFWAALKWDEEKTMIKRGLIDGSQANPLRWMVLIMFLIGLAIGVHLLGLLVIPAIAYIVAYQTHTKNSLKLFVITGVVGLIILVFIQNGVIPGTISLASSMEIFFRNSIGLPFGTGTIIFFVLLILVLVFGLYYTQKKGYKIINASIIGLVVLLIGYGSFSVIVIRSNANPPLDENNPENLVTLYDYLSRKQYGSWPIAYGPYFNSKLAPQSEFEDRDKTYARRWVVTTRNGNELTSFKHKELAQKYIDEKGGGYELVEKYYVTNKSIRENRVPVYQQNTIFPRMFASGDPSEVSGYKSWSGYNPNRRVSPAERGSDGKPLPTFANNLTYLINYQIGWMYWRYFMWNFSGRQNDIQGHGDVFQGNWISGYDIVDKPRLGAQDENSPYFTQHNPNRTTFYYIPLILGLIGLFFHFIKAPKDAIVVSILFLLTGIAIIIYLNQKPFEPRERDYAYATSFYTFAIWIGLGVYGLFEAFRSFVKEDYKKLAICFGGLLIICFAADLSGEKGMPATLSALIIGAITGGALLLMSALRKINFSKVGAASLATMLGIIAPVLMGTQNWDGHDRGDRTSSRTLALNYLTSCSPNAILFTNGDNDTFPLWFVQEVEGVRTDVRVANLSLMQTDWYSSQMKKRAYESDPLPIKFKEHQILMGAGRTDYVRFLDFNFYRTHISKEKTEEIIQQKINANPERFKQSITRLRSGLVAFISNMNANTEKEQLILNKMIEELQTPVPNPGMHEYKRTTLFISKILQDAQRGLLQISDNVIQQLQTAATTWDDAWDFLPIDYAMAFVRNDNNMLEVAQGMKIRFFPSSGFVLPVNTENAVKAGIIPEKYADKTLDAIRFDFKQGVFFPEDVGGLTREEVMMMDILANFNWNRGIFFSSAAGSNVAKAFYRRGFLGNVGQVHGLFPLEREALQQYAHEELFNNLINEYKYGNLNEEGVLVDYYTRRHTEQTRNSFMQLASYYLNQYNDAVDSKNDTLDTTNTLDSPEFYANKVQEVIGHSLTMLPIDRVFDFGTPRQGNQQLSNGDVVYTDGVVAEYVRLLYVVNKTKMADNLALEYLEQLETMINYFEYSDPLIAHKNKSDFIAFAMNFLRTYGSVQHYSPDSPAAEYGNILFQRLSQQVVPHIVEGLRTKEVKATQRGRTITRRMTEEATAFKVLYDALLEENNFITEEETPIKIP